MGSAKTYDGACFCGTVRFSVSGEPAAMGYCHCDSCRRWSAGPVNAFSLWQPASVLITRGVEQIESYSKSANSVRKWCRACGGHLFTEHPAWNLVDVYAATMPGFPFQPGVHVNCQEAVLRIRDDLPKLRDLPKELGGSGAMAA